MNLTKHFDEDESDNLGPWIQTHSGRLFYLFNPRAMDVHMADIAHALSMQCRFAGHCERFYSVAEHCVIGAEMIYNAATDGDEQTRRAVAFGFLLHDSPEAYVTDIPRPVKSRYLPQWAEMEARILEAIYERVRVELPGPSTREMIDFIDIRMYWTEQEQLMRPIAPIHMNETVPQHGIFRRRLNLWSPAEACDEYMRMFDWLRKGLG